ncbi:hypothetical protein EB796_019773 [Bugula neritina]|uniref:Uncharacterized protein n=1 Tax=Bugula neritina TaxID=10212 RepID=A0A7J7J8E4_BUGNE|nr:hypothetical protein EB796_019773 [Bugula neritina]
MMWKMRSIVVIMTLAVRSLLTDHQLTHKELTHDALRVFTVNLELINREGAVLTVESLVRQPSGQYKRLELNYRAKWAVNSQYQCDELTEAIVIGCLLFFAVIGLVVFMFVRAWNEQKASKQEHKNAARSKKVDSAIKGNSVLERVLAHNKAKWKTTAAISRKLTNQETLQ